MMNPNKVTNKTKFNNKFLQKCLVKNLSKQRCFFTTFSFDNGHLFGINDNFSKDTNLFVLKV